MEQVLDSADLRNRLGTVRERVAGFRADYRLHGRWPLAEAVKMQVLQPMTDVRAQIAGGPRPAGKRAQPCSAGPRSGAGQLRGVGP